MVFLEQIFLNDYIINFTTQRITNMKNQFTAIFALLLMVIACGSPQKALDEGDYDKAITDATQALKKNPNNEKNALLLQEAYNKATEQDLAAIQRLKSTASQNPENWIEIFDIYDRMSIREIAVIPVLPLRANGKELKLNMPDVTSSLNEAKGKASEQLYNEATRLLNTGDRMNARKAYEMFDQLVEFNFNYRDARAKRDVAKTKGSTNVFVKMNNNTNKSLPDSFEGDLLTFRDGSFTDPWILYTTKKQPGVNYEYQVDLNVTELIVGRNNEQQRQYREQQRVVVGYKEGRDSNGNATRIPQYATVTADVLETLQTKPIRIRATVIYKDANNKELANIPVEREEAWKNNYAQFRGDQRALSQETVQKIQNGPKEFPTDQQFYELSGKLLNQVIVQLFEQNATNLK